jgi:hypothetical protein
MSQQRPKRKARSRPAARTRTQMPVTSRAAAAGTIETPIVEPVAPRTEPNSVLALSVAAGLLLVIVVLVLFVIAAAT